MFNKKIETHMLPKKSQNSERKDIKIARFAESTLIKTATKLPNLELQRLEPTMW